MGRGMLRDRRCERGGKGEEVEEGEEEVGEEKEYTRQMTSGVGENDADDLLKN